jgi:hypothetical protein
VRDAAVKRDRLVIGVALGHDLPAICWIFRRRNSAGFSGPKLTTMLTTPRSMTSW